MSLVDELIAAFRHAVDGEKRFGVREDCKADLDARWRHVIELLVQLKS